VYETENVQGNVVCFRNKEDSFPHIKFPTQFGNTLHKILVKYNNIAP